MENLSDPQIMRIEVEYAIKVVKLGKAPGPNGINTEVIKLLEDDNIDMLMTIFYAI